MMLWELEALLTHRNICSVKPVVLTENVYLGAHHYVASNLYIYGKHCIFSYSGIITNPDMFPISEKSAAFNIHIASTFFKNMFATPIS